MSKAFTRESDDLPDTPALAPRASALPNGAKNYITATGLRTLQEELKRLQDVERPGLTVVGGEDAKQQLRRLDQRISQLKQTLLSVEVAPQPTATDQVRFGAKVTVRDRSGSDSHYQIVGVDETDIDQGRVSWISPIAKSLLNKRKGDRVRFRFPSGEEELEIIAVGYE